jgi:FkbM family methyltransferase
MAADSPARRMAKRLFRPLLGDGTYKFFQCAAMAWDIRSGNWSEPELELLPYGIREGETALDVGANYGIYCHHMSRAVGASGRVYGFEPVPFTFATLKLIARLLRFRNVELLEKGCGDKNETVDFELPVQTSGAISAGLSFIAGRNNDRQGRETHARFQATRKVPCQVVRIDDAIPAHLPVSLIKADIEGAELFALRGAAGIIDRHHPSIICEINPWFLEGFGIKLDQLLSFLFDRQYQLFWYDDKQRRLMPRTPDQVVEDNYLFVHPSRLNRFQALLG